MGAMPSSIPGTAPANDPYANAQPGTIAYAKSEGPDGIATYTPVIAQGNYDTLVRDQLDRLTLVQKHSIKHPRALLAGSNG
jgi:hypothetical protein